MLYVPVCASCLWELLCALICLLSVCVCVWVHFHASACAWKLMSRPVCISFFVSFVVLVFFPTLLLYLLSVCLFYVIIVLLFLSISSQLILYFVKFMCVSSPILIWCDSPLVTIVMCRLSYSSSTSSTFLFLQALLYTLFTSFQCVLSAHILILSCCSSLSASTC